MFGSNQSINQYQKVGIETSAMTANPVELIVMLYDGAITSCYSAIPYLQKNDYPNKSHFIFKAIRIIQAGLRASLNKDEGGQIAESLDNLYIYMVNLLIKANIENDTAAVQEVIKLLSELRGAWDAISKTDAAYTTATTAKVGALNNGTHLEMA